MPTDFINRANRLIGDGYKLAGEINQILQGSQTKVLAASLKSKEELVATALTGVQHFTLPIEMFKILLQNEISKQAVAQFTNTGIFLGEEN